MDSPLSINSEVKIAFDCSWDKEIESRIEAMTGHNPHYGCLKSSCNDDDDTTTKLQQKAFLFDLFVYIGEHFQVI